MLTKDPSAFIDLYPATRVTSTIEDADANIGVAINIPAAESERRVAKDLGEEIIIAST